MDPSEIQENIFQYEHTGNNMGEFKSVNKRKYALTLIKEGKEFQLFS